MDDYFDWYQLVVLVVFHDYLVKETTINPTELHTYVAVADPFC
jgi:hypothetical protein